MAIKTHLIHVDGERYAYRNLGAFAAQRLVTRVTKLVGPGFGKLVAGGDDLLGGNIAGDGFAAVVEAITKQLDEAELEATSRLILAQVSRMPAHYAEGHPGDPLGDPDAAFAGCLGHMLELVMRCLEVELGPLALKLRSLLPQKQEAGPSLTKTESPTT